MPIIKTRFLNFLEEFEDFNVEIPVEVEIDDELKTDGIISALASGANVEETLVCGSSDGYGKWMPPMGDDKTLRDYMEECHSEHNIKTKDFIINVVSKVAYDEFYPSDDNDSNGTTTGSEGDDDDNDDGNDKKSRDGESGDGDNDHDPSAGASSTVPNMFIPFREENFYPNIEDLENYMNSASIAGIEVVMGKMNLIGEAWAEAQAKLKERFVIMKRVVENQRKALAKAKARATKQAEKEEDDRRPFTVMVQPIGIECFTTTFTVSLPKKSNVKDLKIAILRQMGISYKDASIKKFSFTRERLETEDFTAEEREKMVLTKENHKKDICGASKFLENEKVIMRVAGRGGAGKKRTKTTDVVDEIEVLFAPEVSSDDIQAVKSALALKSISLKGWVESLNHDDAGALMKIMDKQVATGNMPALLSPYMPYIKQFKDLDATPSVV